MAKSFDPYHRWLGIHPEEQPPNLYRLLGLHIFEEDPAVIENAADQRMAHLRAAQTSQHARLAQKLLNEIASAKLSLLDADAKAFYDQKLRKQLTAGSRPAKPPVSNPPPVVLAKRDAPVATRLDEAQTSGRAAGVLPVQESVAIHVETAQPTHAHRPGGLLATSRRLPWTLVVGLVLLLLVAAIVGGLVIVEPDREVGQLGGADAPTDAAAVEIPPPTVPSTGDAAAGEKDDDPPDGSDEEGTTTRDQEGAGSGKAGESATNEPGDASGDGPDDAAAGEGEASGSSGEVTGTDGSPPDETVPLRSPVPAQEVLRALVAAIDMEHPSEGLTPSVRVRLARTLLDEAEQKRARVGERYVLLTRAMQHAIDGGGADVMFTAIDAIGADYEVDVCPFEAAMLLKFLGDGEDPVRAMSFLKYSQRVVERALKAENYEVASRISAAAAPLCERTIGSTEFRQGIRDRGARVEKMRRGFQRFQAEEETLRTDPDNAAAHLTVGRWLCFLRRDWRQGLPHLVRGSDATLKETARRELEPSQNAWARVELADAWWDVAGSLDEEERPAAMRRAALWYDRIDPAELDHVTKLRIEQRQAQLARLAGDADPREDPPAEPGDEFRPTFSRGMRAALKIYDFVLAERLFGRCSDLAPQHVPTLNNFALASVRTEKYGQALHQWEEAIRLAPKSAGIRHNLERLCRMFDAGEFEIKGSDRRLLDKLCASVGDSSDYDSDRGWLYIPLEGEAGDAAQEDIRCMYCSGTGKHLCSNRACKNGKVSVSRTVFSHVDENSGQSVFKTVTYKVPCPQCKGTRQADCAKCGGSGVSQGF